MIQSRLPTLFPYIKGDPTNSCLLRQVSNCEIESFAKKNQAFDKDS